MVDAMIDVMVDTRKMSWLIQKRMPWLIQGMIPWLMQGRMPWLDTRNGAIAGIRNDARFDTRIEIIVEIVCKILYMYIATIQI